MIACSRLARLLEGSGTVLCVTFDAETKFTGVLVYRVAFVGSELSRLCHRVPARCLHFGERLIISLLFIRHCIRDAIPAVKLYCTSDVRGSSVVITVLTYMYSSCIHTVYFTDRYANRRRGCILR